MIFSQWQPDGGYKYFESNVRHPIGDDLPDVRLPPASGGIGVPAQDVGHEIPRGAREIGEGDIPEGVLAPMSRNAYKGLSGTKSLTTNETVVLMFVIGVLIVGGLAGRQDRRRSRS